MCFHFFGVFFGRRDIPYPSDRGVKSLIINKCFENVLSVGEGLRTQDFQYRTGCGRLCPYNVALLIFNVICDNEDAPLVFLHNARCVTKIAVTFIQSGKVNCEGGRRESGPNKLIRVSRLFLFGMNRLYSLLVF